MASELKISLDEDSGPVVIGVTATMTCLATMAIVLRTWGRFRASKIKIRAAEDVLLIGSFILLLSHFALILVATLLHSSLAGKLSPAPAPAINHPTPADNDNNNNDLDLDLDLDDPKLLTRYLKTIFAIQLLTPWTLTLIKLAVLAAYWRLFPTSRLVRRSCATALGPLSVLWCLSAFVPAILRCDPVSGFWNPPGGGGSSSSSSGSSSSSSLVGFSETANRYCNNGSAAAEEWVTWQSGIPDVVLNFGIWLLPVCEIWRLDKGTRSGITGGSSSNRSSRKKKKSLKVAIMIVWSLTGLIVGVSGVMRVLEGWKEVSRTEEQQVVSKGGGGGGGGGPLTWAHVEASTGLIAACLPAINKQVAVRMLERIVFPGTATSREEEEEEEEEEEQRCSSEKLAAADRRRQQRRSGGSVIIGRLPMNNKRFGMGGKVSRSKSLSSEDSLWANTAVNSSETVGWGHHQEQKQQKQEQEEKDHYHGYYQDNHQQMFQPKGYGVERRYTVQGDSPILPSSPHGSTIMIRTEMVWREDHREQI